jgi:hypothetical protein
MTIWTARDILDSIDEGKLRLAKRQAEYDAEAQRQRDEENAGIDAAWKALMDRIRKSIPEWAWDFLTYPNRMPTFYNDHCWMVVPATIDLDGMGQVFVYTWDDDPMFCPARWYLADDDETWSVQADNGRAETKYSLPGNPDFLMALAQAYENMAGYAELKAEADRRNAERQKAKQEWIVIEQPLTREPDFDWLHKARWAVGAATADGNESAIAYALIGILEQLMLVTTPLYGGSQHAIQTFDNSRGQL